jgi:sulfate permease, SulP family
VSDGAGGYGRASPFQGSRRPPLLHRVIPVSETLPDYRLPTARRDILAAVTVAALAIPSAMAYAELAGVTAIAGLYALLLPTVAYALLGSSRQLIVGPEGSLAALVAASILPLAAAGSGQAAELAAMLAILVGACFAISRLLRLGWVTDYFSQPVLIGYMHGVAVVLIVGQLSKLTGISIEARDPVPQLAELLRHLGEASPATLAVAGAALVILLPLRFLRPRAPAALVVVIAGIVASSALSLEDHGVAVVGAIPSGLPSLHVPTPAFADIVTLAPAAVGLFLVCFADEILTARSFAGRDGAHVRVEQEQIAMSAANLAAGLTQGVVVGGSGSRTAVNQTMGARSQIAGLLAAGVVALVLLFLTGPIADLPTAVLGAVIVTAAIGLVDPAAWRALWDADRVELTIAAVTTAGVVVTGLLPAIAFAVGLSIVDVVRRSARPHDAVLGWVEPLGRWADVAVHRDAVPTPGVVVYRLDDRLFFANASYFKGRVHEALRGAPTPPRCLVLDAEAVTHIDTAGGDALAELVAQLRAEGIETRLARLKQPVLDRLSAAGVVEAIGPERFHGTVRAAVVAAQSRDIAAAM